MSRHGFKSLMIAGSVAGAALGCYLVSLNVASERAKLERVEGKIVIAQREIRLLQTEIGTRGRLAQLERWNAGFIRLSAPTADQFLEGGFQLATMVKPSPKSTIEAPVVLASAPADQSVTRPAGSSDGDQAKPVQAIRGPAPSAQDLMHVASYERPARPTAVAPIKAKPTPQAGPVKPSANKAKRIASTDSLAPLPAAGPESKAAASGGASAAGKSRESGTPQ